MTDENRRQTSKNGNRPPLDPALSALPGLIVGWYRENRRRLPWREEVSPYRTLISEIMLQQTRVEAVKPYFERFLSAFPDVKSLADADDEPLLKLWEGLGYYSRARNLKKCAREIVENFGGTVPSSLSDLLSLPGIGPYTAGAVAAFAYGKPVAAVDGNVLRVTARITAEPDDILLPAVKKKLTDLVSSLVPTDAASDFGQGLIELGALICLPNRPPKCGECPVRALCRGYAAGIAGSLPVRGKKPERKLDRRTVLLIRSGTSTLLHKRPSRGLLAGLWEFPNYAGELSEKAALDAVRALGFEPIRVRSLDPAKHLFTHIEWRMTGYLVSVAEPDFPLPDGFVMPETDDLLSHFAIPSAFSAYTRYLSAPLP
ncbi:MAG: A/G-specific adenine glycosylase [Clostridia bacterium]|nr:A/G-specific adenine glycosylase [Clostridia bacterium]